MKKLIILAIVALLGGLFYINLAFSENNPNSFGNKDFTIESGQGIGEIADNLKASGFIEKPIYFELYVTLRRLRSRFLPGDYHLATNMSIKELVRELTRDRQVKKILTITTLEGWDTTQIADYLEEKGIVTKKDFLEAVHYLSDQPDLSYDFLPESASDNRLEGYLFPDTYFVYEGTSATEIINKMLNNFQSKMSNELLQDMASKKKNLADVVTLASIVEKEMFGYEDRRIVAGIFEKRLSIGMGLQSDATINYITRAGNTRPTSAELAVDNLYNTYKYRGLPPGPIGNPSLEAIRAVIYSHPTDYLYFLTTVEGSIIYSRTHDEHVIAKQKYLK